MLLSLDRCASLAHPVKSLIILVSLMSQPACGRGWGWGVSDNDSSCKDNLPDRQKRCAPAQNEGLDTLGENCARDLKDEGLELEIDGECSWVVCIDASEIGGSCDSMESEDIARSDLLIESRFEKINLENSHDIGFSEPLIIDTHCRPKHPVKHRCCYVVSVIEYCQSADSPD